MSQNASEKTPRICSQNNIAEASFSAWPLRFVKAPVNMDTMKIQSLLNPRFNNPFYLLIS